MFYILGDSRLCRVEDLHELSLQPSWNIDSFLVSNLRVFYGTSPRTFMQLPRGKHDWVNRYQWLLGSAQVFSSPKSFGYVVEMSNPCSTWLLLLTNNHCPPSICSVLWAQVCLEGNYYDSQRILLLLHCVRNSKSFRSSVQRMGLGHHSHSSYYGTVMKIKERLGMAPNQRLLKRHESLMSPLPFPHKDVIVIAYRLETSCNDVSM